MKPEEFVSVIKLVVEQRSVAGVIKNLTESANHSDHRLKYISSWYRDLDEGGKDCVSEIIKESVSTTLFGMFCVLDGVRVKSVGTLCRVSGSKLKNH